MRHRARYVCYRKFKSIAPRFKGYRHHAQDLNSISLYWRKSHVLECIYPKVRNFLTIGFYSYFLFLFSVFLVPPKRFIYIFLCQAV